jgi:hypothetical protein
VGAAGAITCGVNRLPPVGLRFFSLGDAVVEGDGDGDGVVVVVVVVVVLDGVWLPPPPHAVKTPIETAAAMPRLAATRRVGQRFFIMWSTLCCQVRAEQTELYRPINIAVKAMEPTVVVRVVPCTARI